MKKILIILIIFFTNEQAQNNFQSEFSFVVWGDTQFHHPDVFSGFIKKTNLLYPSLVVHIGDMINGYTYNKLTAQKEWRRFKDEIKYLKPPFLPVAGNHDITTKEIENEFLNTWELEKFHYYKDYNDNRFIILNTGENQIFDNINDAQLDWLKEKVNDFKGENIFIFFHHPIHLQASDNFRKFHDIIKGTKTKAVFTGHYHVYDYRNIDSIDYFCLVTGGATKFDNHLGGYSRHILYVKIIDGNLNYNVITEDEFYPADAVTEFDKIDFLKIAESEKTIILNSIEESPLDTLINITLKNNSDTLKTFSVKWNFNEDYWQIYPCQLTEVLEKDEEKIIPFHLKAKIRKYFRAEYPYAEISIPFSARSGYSKDIKNVIRLFSPPITFAEKTILPPIIDGQINNDPWEIVSGVDSLFTDFYGQIADKKSLVKFLYDDVYLYVAFEGEEPDTKSLSSLAYGDIPLVFADDDIELFFDTNVDQKTFFRIMANSAGTILSSGPKGRFSFNFDVKTFISDSSWSAEFRIPFSELGINMPSAQEQWGLNIRRHRNQSEIRQADWSKMKNQPYEPQYFGRLFFK